MRVLFAISTLLWALTTTLSVAQALPSLFADHLRIEADQTLIAEGNVEILIDGTTLIAERLIYDRAGDRVRFDGPVFIRLADGTLLEAESGTLDTNLQSGLLQGARMVFNERLQLAANRMERVDDRYAHMYKVAATSCDVCDGRPPLWDIRAEHVIHDSEAQQLYLRNAQLRLRGLPVFWLPRLRFPEPGVDRLGGMLVPRFRSSSNLGFGVEIPFFVTLSPSSDLTFRPMVTTKAKSLEFTYRKHLQFGQIEWLTSLSHDEITSHDLRGYSHFRAMHLFPDDFRIDMNLAYISDTSYLSDYGFPSPERLESYVAATRVTDASLFEARVSRFQGLIPTITSDSTPQWTTQLNYSHHLKDDLWTGGNWDLNAGLMLVHRDNNVSTLDRDVARLSAGINWSDQWIIGPGVIASADLGVRGQIYRVNDDATYDNILTTFVPSASVAVRWPLAHRSKTALHIFEPIAVLHWANRHGDAVPNEDSLRPELDAGNLFSAQHSPGSDVIENGFQLGIGANWHRTSQNGLQTRLTFGTIFRDTASEAFSASTGLNGTQTDYVFSGVLTTQDGFRLEGHSLFDNSFDTHRSEARLGWNNAKIDLSAAYVYLSADAAENRPSDIWEWAFDGQYEINENWQLGLNSRYDVADDSPAEAGIDLRWRNECLFVTISASRKFATSTNVNESTDYSLAVELAGFNAGDNWQGARKSCQN